MKTRKMNVCGKRKTFLCYKDVWVHPVISWYAGCLGSPVALLLYTKSGNGLEYYGDVTVNLPDSERTRRDVSSSIPTIWAKIFWIGSKSTDSESAPVIRHHPASAHTRSSTSTAERSSGSIAKSPTNVNFK